MFVHLVLIIEKREREEITSQKVLSNNPKLQFSLNSRAKNKLSKPVHFCLLCFNNTRQVFEVGGGRAYENNREFREKRMQLQVALVYFSRSTASKIRVNISLGHSFMVGHSLINCYTQTILQRMFLTLHLLCLHNHIFSTIHPNTTVHGRRLFEKVCGGGRESRMKPTNTLNPQYGLFLINVLSFFFFLVGEGGQEAPTLFGGGESK